MYSYFELLYLLTPYGSGVVVWLSVWEGGGYKSVLSSVGANNIYRVAIVEGDVDEHSTLHWLQGFRAKAT